MKFGFHEFFWWKFLMVCSVWVSSNYERFIKTCQSVIRFSETSRFHKIFWRWFLQDFAIWNHSVDRLEATKQGNQYVLASACSAFSTRVTAPLPWTTGGMCTVVAMWWNLPNINSFNAISHLFFFTMIFGTSLSQIVQPFQSKESSINFTTFPFSLVQSHKDGFTIVISQVFSFLFHKLFWRQTICLLFYWWHFTIKVSSNLRRQFVFTQF